MRVADGNGMAATWTTGVRPCWSVHSAGRSSGRGATSALRSGGVLYTQLLRPSSSYTTQLRTVGPATGRSPRVSIPASRTRSSAAVGKSAPTRATTPTGTPQNPSAGGGMEGVAPWRSHRGHAVGVHDVIDRQVADDDDVRAGASRPARLRARLKARFTHCRVRSLSGTAPLAPADGKCRIRSSSR